MFTLQNQNERVKEGLTCRFEINTVFCDVAHRFVLVPFECDTMNAVSNVRSEIYLLVYTLSIRRSP